MPKEMRFFMSVSPDPADDELLFARQLGVECVYTWVNREQMNYDYLSRSKQKVNDAGLELYNVGNMGVGKCDKIILNLPGRDEKIDEFRTFLRNLGKTGIYVTTFTWEQVGVWSSKETGETRGAANAAGGYRRAISATTNSWTRVY